MKKSILNVKGAQELSKNEQKSLKGGISKACEDAWSNSFCVPKTTRDCPLLNGELAFESCGKCCY